MPANNSDKSGDVFTDPSSGWEIHSKMIGNTVYQWAVDSNGRVVSNSEFQSWLQEYKKTHPSNQKRQGSADNKPNNYNGTTAQQNSNNTSQNGYGAYIQQNTNNSQPTNPMTPENKSTAPQQNGNNSQPTNLKKSDSTNGTTHNKQPTSPHKDPDAQDGS